MTNLYKASVYLLLIILGLSPRLVHGQATFNSNWQLGLGIGSTNYYGDLNNYRIKGLKNIGRLIDYNKYYVDQPSFSVMFHKKLTPTLGFMIQANNLQFAMSDRYRKKNGNIDSTAMNYSRSLNFRTTLQDVGIAFTFSPNNGRIGPENVFFYPSFFLGVGVSKFTVKSDLYDENNLPYNYRLPGNIMDGTYETNLRDLRTETDSKFRNVEPYVDLGLALNFRINKNITIALQSDIKYSASDYLDDVSMKYKTSYATAAEAYAAKPGYNIVDPLTLKRGDDNGMNDFYINNRLVLHIGLSQKAPPKKFNPPVIYSLNAPYVQQRKNLELQKKAQDSLVQVKADSTSKAKRDSLISDSFRLKPVQAATDTNVQKQLNSISSQLQEIKTFLRDQQTTPRRQQLQYQSDSLKALRTRITNQRSISREDNLRVRIYGLQLDSLQNEMNRLNWNGEYPARQGDSSLRYYIPPTPRYQVSPSNTDSVQGMSYVENARVEARADSIYQADIRAWENDVRDLKKDNRYKSDAAYKKTVDSLQKKLNEYRRKDPVTRVNPDQRSTVSQSQQVEDQSDRLRVEDQRKLDSLQSRLDSLERVSADSAANASTSIDSLQRVVARDSAADARAINELTRQQQLRADSVAQLRRQLQRSADSVTLYQQQLPATRDTVVQQKRKWYQNIFRRGKNKKEVSTVNDASSTDVYVQREQEHTEQLNTTRARIEQLERDSANEANVSRQNQTFSDQQISRLQTQLKQNADSVAMMRRRLQQSSDSAAYYKTLYASEEVAPDNRQPAKWYQDIFTSEKKMKKKRESEESSRNRIADQERYYDDAAVAMRRQIEDLENRNKEIERDYTRLSSAKTRVNDVKTPVVVYDNNNRNNRSDYSNSDINSLRNEIERLRNQVNNNSQNNTQPLIIQPAPQVPVAATVAPAQTVTDTTQVNNLRSELSAIRSQLDSLRNRPVPVVEKVTPKESTFDPSGFPVISVYFKMGAVTLPQDQLNKILPFGQVASKNGNTNIVLKGFTDPIGNPATNTNIANKRTEYVRNFLVSRFKIDQNRITVEQPSVSESGSSKKPNPLDRRVDMNLAN